MNCTGEKITATKVEHNSIKNTSKIPQKEFDVDNYGMYIRWSVHDTKYNEMSNFWADEKIHFYIEKMS
jgi:hypothetical protein